MGAFYLSLNNDAHWVTNVMSATTFSFLADSISRRSGTKTAASISTKTRRLIAVALVAGFLGIVTWFDVIDFYHRHFFDVGLIVAADNVVRVFFVIIFSWLIYAPGAIIVTLITSIVERETLTPPERAVLGFGVGIGLWHIIMLILGVLGLYYKALVVTLCLAVLVGSSRSFAIVAVNGWQAFNRDFSALRQGRVTLDVGTRILIGITAGWLLLMLGLFPGGGGDYYTHYFYYYLEVLKNHGLTPNDVWYHYYYSKGSGLAFLGMLLTDPEAPALATYPGVVFAGIAIATLAARMAPNSLWPAVGAFIYMFYYMANLGADGGQFQKDHEEICALVTLFVWALCMERHGQPRTFRIMAATAAIAAAIVTQAIGILLCLFVGLLGTWSALRARWSDALGYWIVATAIGATVLGVFGLSYLQTGMASDQPLELMVRFADFSRLSRWGVIPQIIAVAWIRDNYLAWEPELGWGAFKEYVEFLRLQYIWPFLTGPIVATIFLKVSGGVTGCRANTTGRDEGTTQAGLTGLRIAALVALLVAVAVFMGRSQSVSFTRLSSFFVPLLVMLVIAGSVYRLSMPLRRHDEFFLRLGLPTLLFAALLLAWQLRADWIHHFRWDSTNSLRFFIGRYSLAEAYSRAKSPFGFGAINPGALAAARQVPVGTPIWSTNVDSYCMVPGCLIQSVISFKMSPHLDEILGGDPELAKRRLQEAGLNYFLFMKDFRLLDLLPYSRLFGLETIGRFLGVKWSDGSTYLLTWIGPDTTPIGTDFLNAYRRSRAAPESLWFKFNELTPRIVSITPRMQSIREWGAAEPLFTWRHARTDTVDVTGSIN